MMGLDVRARVPAATRARISVLTEATLAGGLRQGHALANREYLASFVPFPTPYTKCLDSSLFCPFSFYGLSVCRV